MTLLPYWPTPEEVNRCVKPEAEGAHDAVLMAVHQPAPLSYRIVSQQERVPTTEDELYRHLLTKNVPTGAHIVPITGASGAGKSHLIRILAARISASKDRTRFLVIRVPKSASLRRVVELILDPLKGARFESVKDEFRNALAEVNLETAAVRFQAELEISLQELATELRTLVARDPRNTVARERLAHAEKLPLLFSDAVTVDHFRANVFPRIVRRAVAGQHAPEIDPTEGQFTENDFVLPDAIDLTQSARPMRLYYQTALQAQEGRGRKVATDLLNSKVVDQAIRQLFKLNEAIGGMTLQEVILEIRRSLLLEGKELVILVEDFKALSGIQDTLSKVLIQEGVRDGVTEFATVRSAIAVTDGYLDNMDTLATRAVREWRVESELETDAEVLSRTTRLVGSYINAARWGEAALVAHFESDRTAKAGENWITAFSVDLESESNELAAFGHVGETPLFPFTRLAIESLARVVMMRGDRLLFNPRAIINEVIRKMVLLGYQSFADNQFPPPSLQAPRGFATVETWLASLPVSEDVRRRMSTVVAIWGNSPSSVADIGRINPKIFEAFGLKPPAVDYEASNTVSTQESTTASTEPTKQAVAEQDPRIKVFQSKLEAWVRDGSTLEQVVANKLRNLIAPALDSAVDWSAECHVRFKIQASHISIPKAGGEGNISEDACIRIADSNEDADGRLREELLALLRMDIGGSNYAERYEDLARIANLMERLAPAALALGRSTMHDKGRIAIHALAANSRILGVAERGRTLGAAHKFLFAEPAGVDQKPVTASAAISNWRSLQADAHRIRPQLKELVNASFGCFQGVGQTPNGIDIVGIQASLQVEVTNFGGLEVAADLQRTLSTMSKSRVLPLAKSALKELSKEKAVIELALGTGFDKSDAIDALKDLAERLRAAGRWPDDRIQMSFADFRSLCEDFRAASVKEAIEDVSVAESEPSPDSSDTFTSRVGRIDPRHILAAVRFVKAGQQINAYAAQYVAAIEKEVQGIDSSLEAERIMSLLESVEASVESTRQKGGSNADS